MHSLQLEDEVGLSAEEYLTIAAIESYPPPCYAHLRILLEARLNQSGVSRFIFFWYMLAAEMDYVPSLRSLQECYDKDGKNNKFIRINQRLIHLHDHASGKGDMYLRERKVQKGVTRNYLLKQFDGINKELNTTIKIASASLLVLF